MLEFLFGAVLGVVGTLTVQDEMKKKPVEVEERPLTWTIPKETNQMKFSICKETDGKITCTYYQVVPTK